METTKTKKTVVKLLVLVGVLSFLALAMAGDLQPGAAPAPTMHTLDEIYAATSSSSGSFVTSGKEFAADDKAFISMEVDGYPGSGFEGMPELEDKCKILKLDHLVFVPFDPPSGQASGVRQHGAVKVVKTIDKATPGLHKALCTGQNISEIVFDFYRIDPQTQQNEVYYKITLRDAHVVEVGPSTDFVIPDSYRRT